MRLRLDKVNEQLLRHNWRKFMGIIISVHVHVYLKIETSDLGELNLNLLTHAKQLTIIMTEKSSSNAY